MLQRYVTKPPSPYSCSLFILNPALAPAPAPTSAPHPVGSAHGLGEDARQHRQPEDPGGPH